MKTYSLFFRLQIKFMLMQIDFIFGVKLISLTVINKKKIKRYIKFKTKYCK